MKKALLIALSSLLFMSMTRKKKQAVTLVNGKMQKRNCDAGGCGYFGASRDNNSRQHLGLDILCIEGAAVYAPFDGVYVSKVDPYGDGTFSGVNMYSKEFGVTLKIMYCAPVDNLGTIKKGQLIAYAQNVSKRYSSVKAHLHIEIIKNNTWVNPEPYLF